MQETDSSKISESNHLRRLYKNHIERWRQSQLGQKEYCRQNEIIPHRFTYWKKRLVDDKSGPRFVPLPLIPNYPASTSKIDLVITGGFKIQIGLGFDPATAKQLIHTLRS